MSIQPEEVNGIPQYIAAPKRKKSILQGILDDAKQSPIYRAGEIALRGAGEAISMVSDATSFHASEGVRC